MPTLRDKPDAAARWDIEPEGEIARGIRARWNDRSGVIAVEIHYSADLDKCTEEWLAREQAGELEWDREFELAWRVFTGKSVYGANFSETLHIGRNLPVSPERDIIVGWDAGLDPCAVFLQPQKDGRLFVIGECIAPTRMAITGLLPIYFEYIAQRFGVRRKYYHCADPAAWQRSQESERSVVDAMKRVGIHPVEGPIELKNRIRPVSEWLDRLVGGKPAFVVDEVHAPKLAEGFRGGYQYPKIKLQGGAVGWGPMPMKNDSSHIHDSLQYAVFLANRRITAEKNPSKPMEQFSWRKDFSGRSRSAVIRPA